MNIGIYLRTSFLFTFFFLGALYAFCQQTTISGKVTDGNTGEGMPFVNVYFKGTTIGTTTDFEGFYTIATKTPADSLLVSYVGYATKAKAVAKGQVQTINFQLTPDGVKLQEVEIIAGQWENPAWEVLRNVVKNKDRNDPRSLTAYEYESYNKIEIDIDNMSEKFRNKKIMRKIVSVFDSLEQIAGEDGKPILPVFISESLSNYYYRTNPEKKHENIIKTRITGVGIDDGSLVSQLIGSTFQQYNFYKNWIELAEKDFVSPIADGWRVFYDYELDREGVMVNGIRCYRINFKPKRPQDLAFTGTMWIADSTHNYALCQIDARITKAANLNFIEQVKIQQEMTPTEPGKGWLPAKTRVLVDIGEVKDDWAGMLAKFYTSSKDIVINKPRDEKFFEQKVTIAEDAQISSDKYWDEHRHDSLTATEKHVYHVIDTIRNLPVVRSYVEIANIAVNGYKRIGKVDVGTYLFTYAHNNIEGHRFRMGMKTNFLFSRKWILRGSMAYGLRDQRIKYDAGVDYILSRKHWTMMGVSRSEDINQIALFSENFLNTDNSLFRAFSRWGNLDNRRPFWHEVNRAYFQTDLFPGFTQKIVFTNQHIDPLFKFEYFQSADQRKSEFTTSEIAFESRFAITEEFLQSENTRISLGTHNRPILLFRYTLGLKNVLGSDFDYQKFTFNITHYTRLGALGRSRYSITGCYIPSRVPYPMLENHLGNESLFYNELSFNMMNYFEFLSDKYVSLNYVHRFEGLFFNSIPLVKKLKWRFLATANVLYGSVSQRNLDLIPATDLQGNPIPRFHGLGKWPYAEAGYGVENIFKFIRIDFLHRLTYLNPPDDRPKIQKFAIKVSAQFQL